MAGDRWRLARAFGFDPIPEFSSLIAGVGLALLAVPAGVIGLVPSAMVLGMYAAERRKIATGLREVEAWGFPVEGYRAWILAFEPAFDLELRADVGSDLLAQALTTIDREIVVETRSPRVVRVVTPRVWLKAVSGGEGAVGDRKLLASIHTRVLAPLHADVGIVAMRMGDRGSLGTLVATSTLEAKAAFRDSAMAAPPALQALVHAGTAQLQPAHEARGLRLRDDRVLHAQPTSMGLAGAVSITAIITGAVLAGPVGGWLGAAVGLVAGITAVGANDRRRARAVARQLDQFGFPVEGYDDWLISARPVMDVELRAPVESVWVARQLTGVQPRLTWLAETLLRIETEPRLVTPGGGGAIEPFWGGDWTVAVRIAKTLLVPLHERVGIVAVRMGGFVDRRE
jgi:hypothetical protein